MMNTYQSSDKRKAELLEEIYLGLVEVDQRIFLLEQKMFGKANFNPSQSRVPAGNPRGGEWTSGGATGSTGSNRKPREYDVTPISTEQAGNVIFNETRSLSSMKGTNINLAREMIAHMIRNGEEYAKTNNKGRRPITADDFITGSIPKVEGQTYIFSQVAAQIADEARKKKDKFKDPTKGSIYVFMAGNNKKVKWGKLVTSIGPFHNSFPNDKVPYKIVYLNFSR